MDKETRKKLVEKYADEGGVAFLDLPRGAGTIAFKCPKQADYERFQDKFARNKGQSAAMRELVLCSMVYPEDKIAGGDLLKRFPAAYEPIVVKLQEMAGSEVSIELKAE